MGLLKDIKSAFKGSKEYQKGKAKKKAARAEKKTEKQKKRNVKKISKMSVKAEKKKKGAGLKSVTKGKKSDPAKLSPTGKLRRGMKGVEVTEGGAYAKYGKKSKAAKSFRKAFAAAKGKDFEWDGRKYSGKKAEKKQTGGMVESPSYEGGGKVESSGSESNPYGWPTRDARNGGQK
jgi:hypothetical protein|tara:strand:- start:104 stop:631 length:528 start_codon:yes stop_codon:yes gene_type:complete